MKIADRMYMRILIVELAAKSFGAKTKLDQVGLSKYNRIN